LVGPDENDLNQEADVLKVYKIDEDSDAESPYKRFSSDIVYQSYFDDNGFIRGENDVNLTKFLNLPSVDLRAKYVGSLIPNFVDKLGRNIWIQKLVNDDVDTVGLLCAENVNLLEEVNTNHDFIDEKIDLIGHSVCNDIIGDNSIATVRPTDFDFLGYNFHYEDESQEVRIGGDLYIRDNSKDEIGAEYPFAWVSEGSDASIVYTSSTVLKEGANVYENPDGSANSDSDILPPCVDEIVKDVKPLVTEFAFRSGEGLFLDRNSLKPYVARDNEVILDINSSVVVGDYFLSDYYKVTEADNEKDETEEVGIHSRISRVVEVKNVFWPKTGDEPGTKAGILVVCSDKIYKTQGSTINNVVVKVTPIDKVADRLQWVCLNGFQIRKDAMPNGTNERQNEILDMIRENPEYPTTTSKLFGSLIDRDYVQFRYLIDTFGLGLEEECKKVYTQLCKRRTSALAIVNCPSQLDFKKSLDPSFTNKSGGVEAQFIAEGGDRSKNPSFLFTLPKFENGATYGAYYYPYLRITDLSAPKSVPPAAYVSNLYIQKYTRGFAWSIVAGQKRGVISGNQVVGVEATLVNENRDWLEPVGINSIIWEQGVGVEVYANKTAKQTPVSALSSIHVREAAIYIQDGIESILRRYVFEFNTAQTRMEIKTLVDEFLETIKNNGGLYDYRTVMDTTNNTAEVIDNNKGVIDVYVEIVRGLEIIAQRLTILKTGAIAAGGFDD
jgi:hypothetical protein